MTITNIIIHNEKEYHEIKEKLDNTGYVLTDSYGVVWEYSKGNNIILLKLYN